jgi:hypothetical protein
MAFSISKKMRAMTDLLGILNSEIVCRHPHCQS